MTRISYSFALVAFLFLLSCNTSREEMSLEPQSEAERHMPEFALAGVQAGNGVQAQLFAAEPLMANPTNIDIDHRGRVWYIENVNYQPSYNPDNLYQEGGDKVVILEDTDGDGQADIRKEFFQDVLVDGGLGICVLDNKVIISSAPLIFVLTDEDRDDVADHVDTLFTGMGNEKGDHTVHAVSFGPDGKLYFNYGNQGHRALDKYGTPIKDKFGHTINDRGVPYRQGMVFRCEIDGSNLEVLAHNFRNNYEVAVDSYGSLWQSDNDDDGNKAVRINYVMEYGNFGFRDELTGKGWGTPRSGMAKEIPARHWHQNDPGVIPTLLITGSGSPTGICVYEGMLLPNVFQNQILHADAGPGTLRAYPVQKDGAGFTARTENLLVRTTDNWYRPSDICVAPDGSVFGADWYDPGVGGNMAGDTKKGRIYRLSPDGGKYRCQTPEVASPTGAVEALKSPNNATRYLAWTALNGFGKTAESALIDLWKSNNSRHRARALWLLGRINTEYVQTALSDADPNIRLTAIRAARQLMPDALTSILLTAAEDPAPEVRREVAIALREFHSPETADIWTSLARQFDGEDRWYLEALGIGAMGHEEEYFQNWLTSVGHEWNTKEGRQIIWRSRAPLAFDYLIRLMEDPHMPADELAPFLRATDFHSIPDKDAQLVSILGMDRKDQTAFQRMLLTHLTPAYAQSSPEVKRVVKQLLPELAGTKDYLTLVSELELTEETAALMEMVLEHPAHELGVKASHILMSWNQWELFESAILTDNKAAIIEVLKHTGHHKAKSILNSFALDRKQDIQDRKDAIVSLAWSWGWEERMKDLLQEEELEKEMKTIVANQLLMAQRGTDREVGMAYLDQLPAGGPAFASLQNLLEMEGDVGHGATQFKQYCSSCHQMDEEGIDFGPALSEIGNKLGRDALFSAIMYPNAGISHGFEGYVIKTKAGNTLTGYIVSENPAQVELRIPGGLTQTILTSEIESKDPLPMSLMTPNLHLAMGEQALVDIVDYLANKRNPATLVSNPFQGKIGYSRE
ncbi:MAG: PVC-type heme-binding CxxCH protein [Bacteroidota bacterium]